MRKMGFGIFALFLAVALLTPSLDVQAFGGLLMMRGVTGASKVARGMTAARGITKGLKPYRAQTRVRKSGGRLQGISICNTRTGQGVNLPRGANSWNRFQSATKGVFGTPREAGSVWGTVKTIKGIRTTPTTTRTNAIRSAWREEQNLVRMTGRGTRKWTPLEKRELFSAGKVRGYHGHHINSVKSHPKLAGNSNNIRFMKRSHHWREHARARARTGDVATHGPLLDRNNRLLKRYKAMNAVKVVPRWMPKYPR